MLLNDDQSYLSLPDLLNGPESMLMLRLSQSFGIAFRNIATGFSIRTDIRAPLAYSNAAHGHCNLQFDASTLSFRIEHTKARNP